MPRRMPERSNDVTVYMVLNDYRTGAGRARQFRIARSEHVEMFPDARPQEEGTAATDRRCMRSAGRASPDAARWGRRRRGRRHRAGPKPTAVVGT